MREKQREWVKANPEKVRNSHARWCKENPEKRKKINKDSRIRRRAKIKKWHAEYVGRDADRINANRRAKYADNQDAMRRSARDRMRKHRARKKLQGLSIGLDLLGLPLTTLLDQFAGAMPARGFTEELASKVKEIRKDALSIYSSKPLLSTFR